MSNFIVKVISDGYVVRVAPTTNIVRISSSLPVGGAGSGTVTSITPAGDSGSGTAITSSGTLTVAGGTGITTAVSGTTITANLDTLTASQIPTLTLSKISDSGTAAAADTGTGSSNVILGNDSRLTDARTPVAHSADLVTSGTLAVARIPDLTLSKITDAGTAAAADTGTGSSNVILGNDSRLTDARTPTSHNHAASEINSGTFDNARIASGNVTQHAADIDLTDLGNVQAGGGLLGDGVAPYYDTTAGKYVIGNLAATAVPLLAANKISSGTFAVARIPDLTLSKITDAGTAAAADTGTGSSNVILGNDSRLTDARTPVAHSADLVTSGTLGVARIPDLTLSKITDSGTAAALDVGTTASKVVQLDGSARLPAVDGSQLTNLPGGTAGNYTMEPITSTWRYFDDFLSVTPDRGPNDGNNQFWMFSGGSGTTPQDSDPIGARGAGMHSFGSDNRRYSYWGGKILNANHEADGDELIWESRVYFTDSTATAGFITLGVADQLNTLNYNDSPPNTGYSSFDFASITLDLGQTNVVTVVKDTGSAGTPTVTDLGASFPMSSYVDVWMRLAIKAAYNAGNSNWDITYYINGSSVGTTTMTFAAALVPFVGGGVGTANGTCVLTIDWISYQGKVATNQISGRTTRLDISS